MWCVFKNSIMHTFIVMTNLQINRTSVCLCIKSCISWHKTLNRNRFRTIYTNKSIAGMKVGWFINQSRKIKCEISICMINAIMWDGIISQFITFPNTIGIYYNESLHFSLAVWACNTIALAYMPRYLRYYRNKSEPLSLVSGLIEKSKSLLLRFQAQKTRI